MRAIRVGRWRIVYLVADEADEVRVHLIGARGQIYRGLR
jgi:hypothetical protein